MSSPAGFRFSATDGVVLGGGVAGAAALAFRGSPFWWLVPFVLVHFLLFCNVFRVRRSFELSWAVALIVSFGAWMLVGEFGWARVILSQTPLTLLLVALEARSRRYHGVGWSRINPEYLRSAQSRTVPETAVNSTNAPE